MLDNSYVIVSACRNEEAYLDGLINMIAAQSLRPVRWIIVDDGSTDGTYDLAVRRAQELPFLQVVKMPGGHPRSFTSQVYAAQHGASLVRSIKHSFIGFLDADIRVEPNYYENLVNRFHEDGRLGLGGGTVIDQYDGRIDHIRKGSEHSHVAGGVQFFRRQCFERIGGYVAIQGGGQDTIADVMVMMEGWKVQTFSDLPALHLRPEGFARDKPFERGMKWGRKFYLLGYHPVFYFGQCVRRLGRRPFFLSSFYQLLGFALAAARRETRPVSRDFVHFHRKMQMQRLREISTAIFSRRVSRRERERIQSPGQNLLNTR